MAASLAHRGPDDTGLYAAGPLALAQTRLSIIDLAGGHQPMVDGALALAANGEIYNFLELRRGSRPGAGASPPRPTARSSSTRTPSTGSALSPPCTACSPSPFTTRARGELVLARDRLGIKPLYYARLPDRLLFASELKALLAVWPREPELDPGALLQYLENQFSTGESSPGRRHPPIAAGHRARRGRRAEPALPPLLVAARRAAAPPRLREPRPGIRGPVRPDDGRAPPGRRTLRPLPVGRSGLRGAPRHDQRAQRPPRAHVLDRVSRRGG